MTATKSVSISITSNEVNIPSKEKGKNTFYQLLQNKFNSSDRTTFSINNPLIKLSMKNNTTTAYNCSGNLKLRCVLPKSKEVVPNYVNVVLNTNTISEANTDLMSILTSFISSPNFIARYMYSDALKESNGVPLINLSTVLDKVNLCWNWNVGRSGYTPEVVSDMVNYYMSKFNELIDYVVGSDLVKVDDKFEKLFVSMFANEDGKLFSHANGSLVLPSLVNWLSVNGSGGINGALDLCGYVKMGSRVFPVDGGIGRWSDDEKESVSPFINVPKDYNQSIIKSKYNYPFTTPTSSSPVVQTPKVSVNYVDGVNVGFKLSEETVKNEKRLFDVYDYERSLEELKGLKYATRIKGSSKLVQIGSNGSDTVSLEMSFKASEVFESYVLKYPGSYQTHPSTTDSGKGKAWCDYLKSDTVDLINHNATAYSLKTDANLKSYILNKLSGNNYSLIRSKSKVAELSNSTISNVNITSYSVPNEFHNKFINKNDAYRVVYKKNVGSAKGGWTCKTISYEEGVVDGSIKDVYGMSVYDENATVKIKVNVSFKYSSQNSTEYTGTFGKSYSKDGEESVCMFETKMDLYFFNENVFRYWLAIIKNANNLQLVLNELRRYLKEHLELVLLNKMNVVMKGSGGGLNANSSFVEMPLGPPLVSIPSSYVIEHKHYFPSFKVNNTVDKNMIKYDRGASSVNVINSITCEETNNFLDVWFRGVINASRNLTSTIDEGSYAYFILPSKGYQLFEVIDKSISTVAGSDGLVCGWGNVMDEHSMLYNFNTPKCVVSMKDFSSDSKLQTLASAYKFICSVAVPVINVRSRNEAEMEVMIDTLSEDGEKENLVYIYISSDNTQELVSALKGAGADEKDKNADKNNVNNKMINIQYNGVDSNKTPICLQLHFE